MDVFAWIERKGKSLEGKPWPKEFAFPLNYKAEFNVYLNTQKRQYEFYYKNIIDSQNNRMKVDAMKHIYTKPDREVHVYDFEKKYLYVGNPLKNMCIRYDLENLSPPSLVRRQSGLNLREMLKDTWDSNGHQTQYLGKYRISRSTESQRNSSGIYHIFRNRQTFVEPERDMG